MRHVSFRERFSLGESKFTEKKAKRVGMSHFFRKYQNEFGNAPLREQKNHWH